MKVAATLILTTLALTSSLGQSEQINQLTEDSVKTGKWVDYDINGKVTSIKFYNATKARKVTPEEAFMYGGRIPGLSKSDSTVHLSIPVGQWITFDSNGAVEEVSYYNNEGSMIMDDRYTYPNSGIPLITRRSGNKTTYVIGNKDSVEFTNIKFYEIRPTTDFFEIGTTVKNLSRDDVTMHISSHERLKVQAEDFLLKSNDSTAINIKLTALPGQMNDVIELRSNEWRLNLEVNVFGYQLTTTDFESEDKKKIHKTFYYYRTGDEYQMEILNRKKNSKPRYLPLSKRFVEIDLSKGTYILTIVGPSGRKSKEIEFE
jgi:hypothetical protein